MPEKSSPPTDEEIGLLSENEFLELERDCNRSSSEYDFKSAGIHTLGAGAFGTMAASAMMSGSPYGPIVGTLMSIPAAVYLWDGIQDIGEGVRDVAKSASADTALRILYQNQLDSPGTTVAEAKSSGRVTPPPQQTLART